MPRIIADSPKPNQNSGKLERKADETRIISRKGWKGSKVPDRTSDTKSNAETAESAEEISFLEHFK